jgi:hypothetical protein
MVYSGTKVSLLCWAGVLSFGKDNNHQLGLSRVERLRVEVEMMVSCGRQQVQNGEEVDKSRGMTGRRAVLEFPAVA